MNAEKKLQEERATLTRFDNELKELTNVIKEKKLAVSQAELDTKGLEHEVQVLNKDRTTAANHIANLEKQNDWIAEMKECVLSCLPVYSFNEMFMVATVNLDSLGDSTILRTWISEG